MKHSSLNLAALALWAILNTAYGAEPPAKPSSAPLDEPVKPLIFNCVSPVTVSNVSVQGQANAPAGWTAEWQTYSQLPMKVVGHRVTARGMMICFHATNTDQDAVKFLQLHRPSPPGKTCKAVPDFRFRCQ